MATEVILAIDVGTSRIKAGYVGIDGILHGYAQQAVLLPGRELEAWDPTWWDDGLRNVLSELGAPASGYRLAGLAMSGNGPTLVALDDLGRPVGTALMWTGPGDPPLPGERSYFLPRVRRFRRMHPGLAERTTCFISCPEYLCHRLGAQRATICPEGEFRHAYWDDAACSAAGLSPDLFPPFVPPAGVLGTVDARGEALFGVPSGTPIFAGGSDFLMCLAGTGTMEPGMVCDRAGSSEGLNLCSRDSLGGEGIRVLPHLRPGYWNKAAILGTTGLMFEWFRGLTGQDGRSYREMMEEIAADEAGAGQVFFFPARNNEGGCDYSRSMFTDLAPGHKAVHLARAVVESIGFSCRRSLDDMESRGESIKSIRISGGQARNGAWNQMKADILGRCLEVPAIRDGELAGCGMAGFAGLGRFRDIAQASHAMVRIEHAVEPDARRHAEYDRRYRAYLERERSCGAAADPQRN